MANHHTFHDIANHYMTSQFHRATFHQMLLQNKPQHCHSIALDHITNHSRLTIYRRTCYHITNQTVVESPHYTSPIYETLHFTTWQTVAIHSRFRLNQTVRSLLGSGFSPGPIVEAAICRHLPLKRWLAGMFSNRMSGFVVNNTKSTSERMQRLRKILVDCLGPVTGMLNSRNYKCCFLFALL